MSFKEIKLGKKVKCNCSNCKGTGIDKNWTEKEDIGAICGHCNGKGYEILELLKGDKILYDIDNNLFLLTNGGAILDIIEPFVGLQKRDDINYVMYPNTRVATHAALYRLGATEINLIPYKEFLKGKYPLPMMKYYCPGMLSQNFGNHSFDNNCPLCDFVDCKKFGQKECWDLFYGEAETYIERQRVLKKM